MKKIIDKIIEKISRKKDNKLDDLIKISELTELELKQWLHNETTLKIVKILKAHRNNMLDGLVQAPNDRDKSLVLGRCKGYDDIIELIEETALNQDDLKAILEEYINLKLNE